jgi:hypothetical protein
VSPAEQRAEDEADLVPLPTDDELDVPEQPLRELGRSRELRTRLDVLPEDLFFQLNPSA